MSQSPFETVATATYDAQDDSLTVFGGPREQADTTAILRRETRSAIAYVGNQLHVRVNHPTYGVTKKSLVAALNRAESLLVALMILDGVVNNFNTNGNPVARYARAEFDFDLDALRDLVRSA